MRHVTIAMERVPRAVLRGGQGQLVKWVNKLSGCQRGFYIYCPILLIHHRVLKKANDNHITVYIYEHYKYMYQARYKQDVI